MRARLLDEPPLLFGNSFPAHDPKTGISLYGPFADSPRKITLGIVGDGKTIDQVLYLLDRYKGPIEAPDDYPLWKQDFPGISSSHPFRCDIETQRDLCRVIDDEEIREIENRHYLGKRIWSAAKLFHQNIQVLKEKEGKVDLIICAPPRKLMGMLISPEERKRGMGERRGKAKKPPHIYESAESLFQRTLLEFSPELREDAGRFMERETGDNFHHFLKSRAMELEVPTQLILPYTLDYYVDGEGSKRQDEATFAWNLCVAMVYKTGGRPWKLASMPVDTCFVGISFYREKGKFRNRVGTSVAQVFTPEGEGLVMRGERFDWFRGKSPRLTEAGAKRILGNALTLYRTHTKHDPQRVVLHKSSKFTDDV
ncbi:MAG: hypothetical protein KAW09_01870, partial [Thermoplasmata archaeon]|nr:hypothetical protein [Thermoplasmata archaeon]